MTKINITRINSHLPDDYDVFICSSSFESRCLTAPSKIKRKHFKKVVVIENKNGSETIHRNTNALLKLFGGNVKILSLNYDNPIEIADNLYSEIKKDASGRKSNLLVDVTAFTHEVLMILLKILSIKKSQVKATCIYTNAADYCASSEPSKKWLSKGCKETHSILGYSGFLFPSLKVRLVLIVGYEHDRAADVIASLEPNALTLVYGSEGNSTTEKNKDANKLYFELVKEMSFNYEDIECVEIPCNDPDKAAMLLSSIYDLHTDENIIVIPMNNKLSTIGVAKSIICNDKIQACYSGAVIYNESDYSIPGSSCYIYDFI